MKNRLKNIFKGQLAAAALYILMGLCLIFMPAASIYVICKVIFGVMLIAGGLYHIWLYIQEKEHATILDLFSGAILLVFGGFLFYNPQIVVKLFPVLFGVFVLVDSIWAFRGALRLKKRNREEWKLLALIRGIFLGLGIALIVNPFTVVKYTAVFAGWVTLANGICDLLFLFLIKKWMQEAELPEPVLDASEQEAEPEAAPEPEIREELQENPDTGAEELKAAPIPEEAVPVQEQEHPTEKPVYQPEEEPATSLGEILQKKAEAVEEVLEEWVDRD